MSVSDQTSKSGRLRALAAVGVCALIWGTTWYAITWQLGTVDPLASVVWRFGLAGGLLMLACLATRTPIRLTRPQHLAALGQGAFAFSISYAFVYQAEEKVPSAIVAVVFAALAFLNLVLFRVLAGQRASKAAWGGALLGLTGVAVLSGGELLGARLGPEAGLGLTMAVVATVASAFGNYFAWKGQSHGVAVLPQTAWAMLYGTTLLAVVAQITGVTWALPLTPGYLLSLGYLAVFGSVVAFLLYFNLARTRGYALASYISALTPPIAMLVSVMFENARFGLAAVAGLILVLAGQVLLIRAPRGA